MAMKGSNSSGKKRLNQNHSNRGLNNFKNLAMRGVQIE
jgi:hypothetical protein